MQVDKVVSPSDVEPLLLSLHERGLTARFQCRPNGLIECLECGHENEADDMPLLALYRVDGPGAEQQGQQVLAVLSCRDCAREGALAFAQGPLSSRDEAVCLAELCSDQ